MVGVRVMGVDPGQPGVQIREQGIPVGHVGTVAEVHQVGGAA